MSITIEYGESKRPIKRISLGPDLANPSRELRRDKHNQCYWELCDPHSVSSSMDLDDLRDLRDGINAILGDSSQPIVSVSVS